MATPYVLSAELQLPIDIGQSNSAASSSLSDYFDARVDQELNYSGSATETVALGTPGSFGLKALYVELDEDPAAAPIYIQFNGGDTTGKVEISPGGFMVIGNPVPVTGIISIIISHTTDVKVRLRGLA